MPPLAHTGLHTAGRGWTCWMPVHSSQGNIPMSNTILLGPSPLRVEQLCPSHSVVQLHLSGAEQRPPFRQGKLQTAAEGGADECGQGQTHTTTHPLPHCWTYVDCSRVLSSLGCTHSCQERRKTLHFGRVWCRWLQRELRRKSLFGLHT